MGYRRQRPRYAPVHSRYVRRRYKRGNRGGRSGTSWWNRIANAAGTAYNAARNFATGNFAGVANDFFPAIQGRGDYVVSSGGEKLAPSVPQFSSETSDNSVVISHREFLGEISTSSTIGAFKVESFPICPSESQTFPWLSQIAQPNFQQYKLDSCVFEFRTSSSDALNSTNTALGNIICAVQYDATDNDPESRTQMENTQWAVSTKPSNSFLIPVELEKNQTGLNGGLLYIINGNTIPTGADPKTYLLGKLFVATSGNQAASIVIGSLYVTYKVRLYKPIMSPPLANGLVYTRQRSGATESGNAHFGTSDTNSATGGALYDCDSIGVTLSGNVMTLDYTRLQEGQRFILLLYWYAGSTASVTYPSAAFSSGLEGQAAFADYTSLFSSGPYSAATCSNQTFTLNFKVLAAGSRTSQTITLTGGVVPKTAGVAALSINLYQICGINTKDIGQIA